MSEVQPVFTVSKSTSMGLVARGSACLFGFRTYLQMTVGQGCSMFIRFPNLPNGNCCSGMQPVFTVSGTITGKAVIVLAIYNASKPYFGPFVSDMVQISYIRTYLWRTVDQECNMFVQFTNLPPGDCLPGLSLFIRSPNLPPGDCLPGLQPVSQHTLR